jgi:hypothetical protein
MSLSATDVPSPSRQAGGSFASVRLARLRRWERPLLHGALLASIIWVALIALGRFELGSDARAYWLTGSIPWYSVGYAELGAYTYSPAFAEALSPFVQLPWPAFAAIWASLLLVSLFVLGGRWTWALLFMPPVAFELYAGNVHLLLAGAIVIGFRHPAAWSFVLLTKVTPGIGLVWFALRREWRALLIAVGATAAIVAVSYALDPGAWLRWVEYLGSATGVSVTYPHLAIPLVVRLPISALVVAWGALTDRRWTVPVAAMLALPVIWPGSLAMLVGLIPLQRRATPSRP